jgi:hypothetical protein
MRISFDIDDTLVIRNRSLPSESGLLPDLVHRKLGESLRLGTIELFRDLRRRRWEIWIYTTSERTPWQIRRWLWLYGIQVDGIVNGDKHREVLALCNPPLFISKYPPAFDIDLHVDDSEGVKTEGEANQFRVIVVKPDDEFWTGKVLEAVQNFPSRKQTMS